MRIETPQILWHNCSEGNGKAAPLYSISFLPKTSHNNSNSVRHKNYPGDSSSTSSTNVLATAGNSNEIHLWNISFSELAKDLPKERNVKEAATSQLLKSSATNNKPEATPFKSTIFSSDQTKIRHFLTLSRHERSVNALAFSPDGIHLASGGDGGSIILHSLTHKARALNDWGATTSPKELNCSMLHSGAQDVMDIDWSPCSKRLVVGTLDHSVLVYESTTTVSNVGSGGGVGAPGGLGGTQVSYSWTCVSRNTTHHTHYVQGVAYDPLGVYLASQGSDRTVGVWSRKKHAGAPPTNKKVLGQKDKNQNADSTTVNGVSRQDESDWMNGKFELGAGTLLKYRYLSNPSGKTDPKTVGGTASSASPNSSSRKRHLFADESTVGSFFRRLSWATDGAFLITPASLYHEDNVIETGVTPSPQPQQPLFSTFLFARHAFDRPYKVLSGLEKPSVVIRPHPHLFQLPPPNSSSSADKENIESSSSNSLSKMSHRSIFAVLTLDSVLIYDTYHSHPLSIVKGLHFAGLTDCAWTPDGLNLAVSSTDGYLSMISFQEGELGTAYSDPARVITTVRNVDPTGAVTFQNKGLSPEGSRVLVPPCDPGQSATLVAPPTKKAKFTPQNECESPSVVESAKPSFENENHHTIPETDKSTAIKQCGTKRDIGNKSEGNIEKEVVGGVRKLSIDNEMPRKKKKRVQPTLLSCGN